MKKYYYIVEYLYNRKWRPCGSPETSLYNVNTALRAEQKYNTHELRISKYRFEKVIKNVN